MSKEETGKRVRSIVLLATALLMADGSQAASYGCTGIVTQVTVDPAGLVNATFSFHYPNVGGMAWQSVCNISETAYDVAPEACRGILSVLMAAKTTGAGIQVWFDNGTSSSCTATAWSSLKSFGWYWGPSIQ